MGLYGMLFGVNPLAGVLLKALDIGIGEKITGNYKAGRFRDIYLSGDGTKIILYTRNGARNRECWEEEGCPGWGSSDYKDPSKHDPECLVYVNWKLTQHPLYVKDYDDGFDPTYAYFEFRVPDVLEPVLDRIMRDQGGPPKNVTEKFNEVVAEMKSMTREQLESDPRFRPLANLMKTILEDREPGVAVATVDPDGIEVKKYVKDNSPQGGDKGVEEKEEKKVEKEEEEEKPEEEEEVEEKKPKE